MRVQIYSTTCSLNNEDVLNLYPALKRWDWKVESYSEYDKRVVIEVDGFDKLIPFVIESCNKDIIISKYIYLDVVKYNIDYSIEIYDDYRE